VLYLTRYLLDDIINKSTNQQINKSTNQQINKSTNQQINKSTNQQINKWLNLSKRHKSSIEICRLITAKM
jgi:small-conductance mechanosensitive channel